MILKNSTIFPTSSTETKAC